MNSGYLWFSGRWPFGRSAGYFTAPISQSDCLGLDKIKTAEMTKNYFLGLSLKIIPVLWKAMFRVLLPGFAISTNHFNFCIQNKNACYGFLENI